MKHKQTLRRGLGILLSLVLCLSLLPAVTLTAAAADEHTHCICGSKVAECVIRKTAYGQRGNKVTLCPILLGTTT